MSRQERAYRRLADANPVPDLERSAAPPIADVDDKGAEALELPGSRSRRPQRRWAAAAVVLVVVGAVTAVAVSIGGDRRSPVATSLGIVDSFFSAWNEGDVDGAMDLVDPEPVINLGFTSRTDLRGLIEWSVEFDGSMNVTCASAGEPFLLECEWAFLTAATEALGLSPAVVSIEVHDGVIAALTTPNYAALEQALAEFARREDPEGFAASCNTGVDAPRSLRGFSFTAECGDFLAALEPALLVEFGD